MALGSCHDAQKEWQPNLINLYFRQHGLVSRSGQRIEQILSVISPISSLFSKQITL